MQGIKDLMSQIKKRTKVMLVASLATCLLCGLGMSLAQSSFGTVNVKPYTMSFTQLSQEIEANNAASGKNIEVTFTPSKSAQMGFIVLTPPNASAKNPAPCIITCHGGANQKEMQSGNYTELAKRGFVVVSIDGSGHGNTDVDSIVDPLTHNSHGMEAAIEYAMSLNCVDETQIGVTGHSWGNDAACQAVNFINLHSTNPKIKAQLIGAGAGYFLSMEEGANDGMHVGILMGQYDEYDTSYFVPTPQQLGADLFKNFFSAIDPSYSLKSAPVDTWYTKDGPYQVTPGEKVDAAGGARIFYNPPITHLMVFSTPTGVGETVDFFYGAFGVPQGASYIPATSQTWVFMPVLSAIGMVAILLLILSLVDILLLLPWFAPLARKKGDVQVLPSLKNPKESGPALAMAVLLVLFSFFTIKPLTSDPMLVGKWFPTTPLFPVASNQGNAIAVWELSMGAFILVLLFVIYLVKLLLNYKDTSKAINPFKYAKFESGSQFFRTLFMAVLIAVLAYLPIWFNYNVFHVDFLISTLGFTAFSILKVPMIMRYILLLVVFFIANAIIAANTKFKELPDWASVLIIMVMNLVGIVSAIAIEYHSLFTTGSLKNVAYASTDTVALLLIVGMIFTPIIYRYTEKKTNNIWLGALFNSIWFTTALVCNTRYIYSMVLVG